MDTIEFPSPNIILPISPSRKVKRKNTVMPRKKKISRNDLGIPEYEIDSLARVLLPILQKYLASEEERRDWQERNFKRKTMKLL